MWVILDHPFFNLRVNQSYCPIGGDNIPLEENFKPMKNAKLHNFYKSQKLLLWLLTRASVIFALDLQAVCHHQAVLSVCLAKYTQVF